MSQPSGSSARSKKSVSVAWSRLARLMYASSSTSSSNITITRETIRAATTNSRSDGHLRSTRTPTLSGGSASADFSASTTQRPHEGAADYLHLTRASGSIPNNTGARARVPRALPTRPVTPPSTARCNPRPATRHRSACGLAPRTSQLLLPRGRTRGRLIICTLRSRSGVR